MTTEELQALIEAYKKMRLSIMRGRSFPEPVILLQTVIENLEELLQFSEPVILPQRVFNNHEELLEGAQ